MGELNKPERRRGPGRPFAKGVSGNPGGQSKEKRAFLDRLTTEDAETIYEAFMGLVRDGNPPAVLRAVEYLAGKPRSATEDLDAMRQGSAGVVAALAGLTRDEKLAIARGLEPGTEEAP